STGDVRAPQKAANPADRIASTWYSWTSFSLDVNVTDGQAHELSLYFLDWDRANRNETVSLVDADTGAVLDSRAVTAFAGGQYLSWNVSGHVQVRITNGAGSINAVLSGVFLDSPGSVPASPPSTPAPGATAGFVGVNTTVQGSWQ